MGDCHVYHEEIRISIRKPDITEVWIYLRGEGDCSYHFVGWRYKAFPAPVTAHDIVMMWGNGDEDPLTWPRQDPPPTELNYTPDFDAIEAQILEQMGLVKRGDDTP